MKSTTTDDEVPIIDTDVHQMWESVGEILAYLPRQHHHRFNDATATRLPGVPSTPYGNPSGHRVREDLIQDGVRGFTSPEHLAERHLNPNGIEYAVLNGDALGLNLHPNPKYATALARAINEWVAHEWLPEDDRFVASIYVPQQCPEEAAEIIDEWEDHPRFVQVAINSAARELFGKPQYWPLYEAAEAAGLPVMMHVASDGAGISGPTTAGGYPSTFFEHHNIFPTTYMAQINSLICEGVFVEFPDLTVVAAEGGIAWAPHLMWRMDKNYKACRRQVPWLKKLPSEYFFEHIRFTQQPIPEPRNPEHLLQILDMIRADKTLMFSSDFPHWDGDYWTGSRQPGLPPVSDERRRRILHETAKELYGLPDDPSKLG